MKDQPLFNSYKGVLELKNSVLKNYLFINQFVESQKKIRKFVLNSNLISAIGERIDNASEPKKGLQELRTEIIEAAFQKITQLAKEQEIIIHRDRMPGTKSVSVQGQILPFASILKNYKSYKSQWEQRARSDPSPNTILSPNIP
ncbi:TPA: hypothetical protein JBD73_03375 [Legionella pneumophila subsp. pneumophila]|nr:hypothetical protein [Legionella pneumophila subsp. pneumophila]